MASNSAVDNLAELLQRGFMICQSQGNDEGGCVTISFPKLEDAQDLHQYLVNRRPSRAGKEGGG